jgi:membrane protein
MRSILTVLRETTLRVVRHDVLNTAKAAAYSGILLLFPALLLFTTALAVIPEGNTLLDQFRFGAEQFLPADTMSLLQSYFQSRRLHSFSLIASAIALSGYAALGVMLSLMEGFRRAYRLPQDDWGFWERRIRALMLGPIALIPLSAATLLLIFGHPIEKWMIANSDHDLRAMVLLLWRLARWILAMLTSVVVLGTVYHFGTRRREHWGWVAPGAVASTLIWFPETLAFGWYLTRRADYSIIYGPLSAGIATLVWLYMTSLSILLGAELNGVLFHSRIADDAAVPVAASAASACHGSSPDPGHRTSDKDRDLGL